LLPLLCDPDGIHEAEAVRALYKISLFLLSISKKKKGGCFLNNSLTEIAIGLRFSPFNRGEHSASFYMWLKNPVCKCDE
jgi:hypothetical protein